MTPCNMAFLCSCLSTPITRDHETSITEDINKTLSVHSGYLLTESGSVFDISVSLYVSAMMYETCEVYPGLDAAIKISYTFDKT